MQEPCIPYIEADEDKPMPSLYHSRVAQNLGVLLHNYSDRYDIYQQLALRLNDWPSIPDIVLYPKSGREIDWTMDKDEATDPPLLVIEILSPHQVFQSLIDKIREYLQRGVKSCWLVQPGARVVIVFPASGPSRTFAEGDVIDPALGISLPISGIFR